MKQSLVCPHHCCGAVYECEEEAAEEIRRTGRVDFSAYKKQQAAQGSGGRCPCCGSQVTAGFSYCPYCGNKL